MTDPRGDARRLLETLTDGPLLGEWSAPGRVNLIGEHTDYNDGFVLPFAIDRRTHVAVGRLGHPSIRVASTYVDAVVEVPLWALPGLFPARPEIPEWAAYPLGVAWALMREAGVDAGALEGVALAIASDVPVGAGLSSSAAVEGATAAALDELWGTGLDPAALARIGRIAENDAVGAPTGIMDQMASMLGRADAALFLDCRSLEARPVALGLDREGIAVLVIDTRVSHAHATGGYAARREACERGAAALGVPALRDVGADDFARAREVLDDETFRRVRHVVTENARVLAVVAALEAEGPRAIEELLLASHASMRDDFEISVPELDAAVGAAMTAGAIGARMTGGGFGGAAIALVPAERANAVEASVRERFAADGFGEPTVFAVRAAGGARREP